MGRGFIEHAAPEETAGIGCDRDTALDLGENDLADAMDGRADRAAIIHRVGVAAPEECAVSGVKGHNAVSGG